MQQTPTEELTTIWEGVREELRRALPPSAFDHWLEPLRPVGAQGGRLFLSGPERVRTWFERRYGGLAIAALRRQEGDLTEIAFADGESGPAPVASELPLAPALERELDFDRFVIGDGNRFAHAAALAVAELPGEAYNPLFLYGDPGLGKTHLLVAIANYLRRRRPDLGVLYTTAERFTAEFVVSVRGEGRAADRFKQRYREIGALLIDDVQFLEDKPRTEDEFFHTFNELHAAGKQIVLSSDRPPEAIERLTERLRDRFAWGLTVQVEQPDLRTRMAMLRRLAGERGLDLPDVEVVRRIALATPTNLRKLEGALTRVIALASVLGEKADGALVDRALGASAPGGSLAGEPALTIEAIQQAVCEVLHLPLAEMRSARRTPDVVRGRQLAMYVARNQTELSLAEIARGFERDHSTALHSIRTAERRLEPGSDLRRALDRVHELLHIDPAGP